MNAEFDDLFVFMPSFLLAERLEAYGGVFEGKAIGTAEIADLALKKDQLFAKDSDPKAFANERKKGQTVGGRKFKAATKAAKTGLLRTIRRFQQEKIEEKEFRREATKTLRVAWRDVFLSGLRAGGTKGEGSGKGKVLVKLDVGDDKWLRSAVQHEMRFLNKFLTAIIENTYTMPLKRRVGMYVDALESFYDSSRVIALPSNIAIWWQGPNDKRTCPSCEYLFENSPYSKITLPTTPRSGLTICLTNCRDRLWIKRVPPEKAESMVTGALVERQRHIRKLRKIKKEGRL
jgi:hypothetical protein